MELNLKAQQEINSIEDFKFEPIKGQPMLRWQGKRAFESTNYYPAQLKETFGEEKDGWINKIYWGDNLQVMSHLLKKFRGQVDLIYIDPPFDSKADYKKTIELRGRKISNDSTNFEEKQYTDIWTNDEYMQFMYERLILMRELLSEKGSIYLHCDWHKVHLLRCIMNEIFGSENFLNEIIWGYRIQGVGKKFWARKHDDILFYAKNANNYIHNSEKEDVIYEKPFIDTNKIEPTFNGINERSIAEINKYLNDKKALPDKYKSLIFNKYYSNVYVRDVWDCDSTKPLISGSSEYVDYPTQKPEGLINRIIKASSNPGDLVFDCFMGSGTTQAVAMKLGRRFIGADINLGAIDTTVKRLLNIKKNLDTESQKIDFEEGKNSYYTGFEVYNVNNYDVFRNPVEARDILKRALEIQPLPGNDLYDGEKDGRMVKIMPVNRIATRVDLNELITNFPRKTFDERKNEHPNKPVEYLSLICMGHEPDLGEQLKLQLKNEGYIIDVEVVDILRDKSNLEFKRDSEADIRISGNELIIKNFYPMNLLQKLSIQKENVDDWRKLVDSIKIDFNYDGSVFEPTCIDIPEGKEIVKGTYKIPSDAGTIRVKITDVLSESLEMTIKQ